jgi:hypothetical protein
VAVNCSSEADQATEAAWSAAAGCPATSTLLKSTLNKGADDE